MEFIVRRCLTIAILYIKLVKLQVIDVIRVKANYPAGLLTYSYGYNKTVPSKAFFYVGQNGREKVKT